MTPPRTWIIHTTEGYRVLWSHVDGSFDHEYDVVRIYGVETFETLDVLREALDLDGMSHGLRHKIGVQIRELAKAETPAAPEVQEVNLCEYVHLSVRPDVLYRFTVDETCVGCVSLARAADPKPGVVCSTCSDTHRMWYVELEREVLCTRCPTPCQDCRAGGTGPYCAKAPCSCKCHGGKRC